MEQFTDDVSSQDKNRFVEFLFKLATDSELAKEFAAKPEAVMRKHNIAEPFIQAVLEGDLQKIYKILGTPSEPTKMFIKWW